MSTEHSWKWLPPRFKGAPARGSRRSRACLPPVEQLDDRLLLSTAPAPTPDPAIAALIGLLRNEIGVRTGELDVLKIATAGLDVTDKQHQDEAAFVKIQGEFMKLDAVLDKVSVDAVNGGISAQKVREATVKIDGIFHDIGLLLPYFSGVPGVGDGLLLPAVQKVHAAATQAVDAASKITKIKVDNKVLDAFVKSENELLKIDAEVQRYSFADIKQNQNNKVLTEIKLHIAASFDKLSADVKLMGDGSVFKGLTDDLATLKIDTLNFLNGLPAVQLPGGGGNAALNAVTLENLGDLIIE